VSAKRHAAAGAARAGDEERHATGKRIRSRDERVVIPTDQKSVELSVQGRIVALTNLPKPFWAELGITKGDLIQYYADVAPVLLPHLRDRAMVMKRYPHGAYGKFFFMKRAPVPRPGWIRTCSIEHESRSIIEFPVVQDLATLLWLINLGCIDLNPWYARCDDVDRPDF
jgi:bifunctional non-homologous end joining protein LigD